MIIRFEYCPILGLKYWEFKKINNKSKNNGVFRRNITSRGKELSKS